MCFAFPFQSLFFLAKLIFKFYVAHMMRIARKEIAGNLPFNR